MHKICAHCGEPFDTKVPNKIYCDRQHYSNCSICGIKYPIKNCREYAKTCSRKCGAELRKRTCNELYGGNAPACSASVRQKTIRTNLAKYGTIAPMQNVDIKDKAVQTNMTRYGVEWACQSEDSKQKCRQTNITKYGSENPMSNAEVQKKRKDTMRSRYGVEYLMQSEEYRKQREQQYLEKTGYKHPWANPQVQAKSVATWRKKYGDEVSRPLQAQEVREHLHQTNISKYGVDNPWKNPEIREKIRQTNLHRYHSANPMGNAGIKAKVMNTMELHYGKPYYAQTDAARLSVMQNPERLPYLKEFQADPCGMIDKYFPDHKPTLRELQEFLGVTSEPVYATIMKFNCHDKIAYVFSYMENEVQEILKAIDPNIKMDLNTRSVIAPYELDIYLPEYSIGIECNPTATHNSSRYAFEHIDPGRSPTAYNYHKMKTDLCETQGVFLFHIFGYDLKYHREIIVSMLKNLLHKNSHKYYARATYVKLVSPAEARQFLSENHRQGIAQSAIQLGLYLKSTQELVSLMTFGKMRTTIGIDVSDLSECWELVRFCNKLDTSVVGGASKLFAYFVNTYCPKQIRSFSDRSHTKGELYKILGFYEIRRSTPNYVWVDMKTDRAYHRINAQKRNLKKFLKDDALDLTKTEKEIMESHGYVQVYDSGTITWEWKP